MGFPIAGGGCTLYWYVSLTHPGNPVSLWDGSGWDYPEGPIEAGIVLTVPTLAEWLSRWSNGQDLYEEIDDSQQ
ncbi:hypothetical protein Msi02_62270 [Microbispora siamensis]|uniref:SMI1/KNR4 family protein n=1 Tax=Microbispora siamensis TaxID=564413 RepID=A0ABQ4GVJ9_9ACTN|nr:hypothetical protein Msi02_62270 [Microbispora siamensis]